MRLSLRAMELAADGREKPKETQTTKGDSSQNPVGFGEGSPNVAITLHSDGSTIILEENPQAYAHGTSTGWVTWNASFVLCEFLQHHAELIVGKNVCDISSGNGLVAMCCARLGAASVCATEVNECTALTLRNVQLNGLESLVRVIPYYWGAQPCPLSASPEPKEEYSIVFLTDLLYIAIRDSLEAQLEKTLRDICGPESYGNVRVMFAFEERALEEEAAFMARITEGAGGLSCEEISPDMFDLSVIQPEGEFAAMLWEPPSMRFYWLESKIRESK